MTAFKSVDTHGAGPPIKPTPGPWREGQDGNNRVYGPDSRGDDSGLIAVVYKGRGNTRLITEAGTVHHETGLTPQQLREQRDELLAALRDAETAIVHLNGEVACEETLHGIRAAIAKVEGRS